MSSTAVPAAAPPPAETPGLSEGERLLNAVIAPSLTFRDLKRRAAFWAPMLIIIATQVLFVVTIDRQVGFEQVARNNLAMNERAAERIEQLPPEQRDRQIRAMATGTKVFSYGFPVVWFIMMLVVSGLLLATFNFGLGAEVKYKTALAIVIYASLAPGVVRAVLAVVSLLAGADPESFNIQNPVGTNPGYFIGPSAGPLLYGIASGLDVIMFWTLALTGLGFACVSKVKTATAMAVPFGWWFVFVLGSAALGAAFS